MGKGRRTEYTAEFKRQALGLAARVGINKAAKDLGVSSASVRNWKSKQEKNEPKVAKEMSLEEEVRRLRKENEELKTVNYILKRAAAVFSQDQLK